MTSDRKKGWTESVKVRPMTRDDVDAVSALERATFSTPWSAETFLALQDREPDVEIWVAQADVGKRSGALEGAAPDGVTGYAVMWCVADQAELANLAVRPDLRGTGVGSALLDQILNRCSQRGAESVFLEVRSSNEPAQDLYRSRGFRMVGVRKRYYREPFEDACVMMCTLAE